MVELFYIRLMFLVHQMKVLAPLPIGFAVFMVHLATIPITGTGINPARSFGAAVIYNNEKAWDDQVSIFNHLIQTFCRSSLKSRRFFWDFDKLIWLNVMGAVDFLGWTFCWSTGCGGIPPVHSESSCYQGFGIIPQQPYQLRQQIQNPTKKAFFFLSICWLLCVNDWERIIDYVSLFVFFYL